MSYSHNFASPEFHLLCQSQIKLLTQALGGLWSAVYLTEESIQSRETNLFPFMIYPQNESQIYQKLSGKKLPEIWQQVISERIINPSLLLPDKATQDSWSNRLKSSEELDHKQLVLPLMHENTVMGLLIIAREKSNWEDQELEQAKNIAQTLAIARFMDRQSQWYRKQLELQEEANRWQQDRLDDLLHQLRNPLTALKTFSKLLIKRLLPDEKNQSFAESMLRESDRLSGLLQQFETEVDRVSVTPTTAESIYPPALPFQDEASMVLSNRSADLNPNRNNFLLPDSKKDLESVALKAILKPLILTTEAIALEKEIKLLVNIRDDLPLVKGNPQALREVFNNLIDNAIKYTPSKGTVKLETKIQNGLVGIAIEDTGYGIPAEIQPQIFQRHYRGIQAEGDIPGTGLGLAIAKNLMVQMAGDIELISPNNLAKNSNFPGTTFIVWMRQIQLN
ncbi:MAG: ATP-binding protein [Xenococcaceae cyanobacterium MO_188.B19]|nr:ATP-binding protein [Xenococcaceae cyanobacterium MO_188.B19]